MKAYVDGSSVGYYGYLITSPERRQQLFKDHQMTNNQAEWLALISLLLEIESNSIIVVISDSLIVVNQLKGIWQTKDATLRHMKALCEMIIKIKKIKLHLEWQPRKKNLFGKYLEKVLNDERKKRRKYQKKLGIEIERKNN